MKKKTKRLAPKKTPQKFLHVKVDEEFHDRITAIAKVMNRTISGAIRQLVDDYKIGGAA